MSHARSEYTDFQSLAPDAFSAVRTLSAIAVKAGLDKQLVELIKIRASQINGCAFCIEPCPYQALSLVEYMKGGEVKKTVEVNEVRCKGCGSCMATCPRLGIGVKCFTIELLVALVDGARGVI
jgi:heterodisulfide reductase subunit A